MPRIELVGLTKAFDGMKALDGLDLEIGDGEYVVILGPTGAGKTTLLRLISGILEPTSGQIIMDGRRMTSVPPEDRNVAFLSQSYSLFPQMNVWENTVFSPTIKGWKAEDIELLGKEMLDLVRLNQRFDALPGELSGGMQQRNALARALASSAKVLLLDEPLRALDARLRLDLRHELRRLSKDMGMTTIHVTHDQEEALTVADRIVVLRRGRAVQVGTPRQIFDEPAGPFVADFVGQSNFISGMIVGKGVDWTDIEDLKGRTFRCRGSRLPIGDRAVAAIKSDRTSVRTAGGQGQNHLKGTVERSMFLGRFVDLLVRVDGEGFHVKMHSSLSGGLREGSEVTLRLEPSHMLVFPYPKEGLEKALEVE